MQGQHSEVCKVSLGSGEGTEEGEERVGEVGLGEEGQAYL